MAAKKIIYGHDASEAIKKGVKKLAQAVKVTLGPKAVMLLLKRVSGRLL